MSLITLSALFTIVTLAAHADTYQLYDVGNANYEQPAAVDDYGDFEINLSTPFHLGYLTCDGLNPSSGGCYQESYANGEVTYTSFPIPLYPSPAGEARGPGCPTGVDGLTLYLCANGHPIYETLKPGGYPGGLYYGDSLADLIPGTGLDIEHLIVSGDGQIIFSDEIEESINLVIDKDTLAIAPEPSSFILLGSGVLAMIRATHRRKAQ